jgi:hypothetical protein
MLVSQLHASEFKNRISDFLALAWFAFGAFSSFGIFFEAPGRRLELAQYVFPRILEGNIQFFKKRRYLPKRVPFGSVSSNF